MRTASKLAFPPPITNEIMARLNNKKRIGAIAHAVFGIHSPEAFVGVIAALIEVSVLM